MPMLDVRSLSEDADFIHILGGFFHGSKQIPTPPVLTQEGYEGTRLKSS
jgi:hypothetical protein